MTKIVYGPLVMGMILLMIACGGGRAPQLPAGGELPAGQISVEKTADVPDVAATVAAAATTTAAQLATSVPKMQETAAELAPTAVPEIIEMATAEPSAITAASLTVTDMASLQAKMGAVQLDGSGQATITITDDELNRVFQAGQQNNPNPAVSNPTVLFTGGYIAFSAGLTQPVNGVLVVNFSPYVTNSVLQFDVLSATLDGRRVPPAALEAAEQTLNTTLAQAMSQLPAGVNLTAVTMGEGTMQFTLSN